MVHTEVRECVGYGIGILHNHVCTQNQTFSVSATGAHNNGVVSPAPERTSLIIINEISVSLSAKLYMHKFYRSEFC